MNQVFVAKIHSEEKSVLSLERKESYLFHDIDAFNLRIFKISFLKRLFIILDI